MANVFTPTTGVSPVDFTLPDAQVGSDNTGTDKRVQAGEVVLQRHGLTISARKWAEVRRWTFNYNSIPTTNVDSFKEYFQARTFIYQPTGTSYIEFNVRWVGQEFKPSQIAPGQWSLNFTIEEVVS